MGDSLPKFILLIPLNYNDGREVPKEVLANFREKLFALGGGFSIAGTVEGAYRMADGTKMIDHSLQIWIGLEEEHFAELERAVAELGAELGQESMYLERSGGTIHFIPPQPPSGGSL
ncbi:MAG: hypothetical protein HQ567_14410 [Candidatus Nealsonbacteria bacterium]|nr:hypothetical protein [Candidatus Nealsonbacteria bacterium]